MPILSSIKESEEKAERMRREADEKVRVLLEETKTKSENQAQKMLADYAQKEISLQAETEKSILSLEKDVFARADTEDQIIAKKANDRMDTAVDQILKKVLKP